MGKINDMREKMGDSDVDAVAEGADHRSAPRLQVLPHRRKQPAVLCPECESKLTWRKGKNRIYCRQCKKYHSFQQVYRNSGNAAWHALSNKNGRYKAMWRCGAIELKSEERFELMQAIDELERREQERRQAEIKVLRGTPASDKIKPSSAYGK